MCWKAYARGAAAGNGWKGWMDEKGFWNKAGCFVLYISLKVREGKAG